MVTNKLNNMTAVEWLEYCFDRYGAVLKSDFTKAKAMEKEQIINAYNNGNRQEFYDGTETKLAERYYEQK